MSRTRHRVTALALLAATATAGVALSTTAAAHADGYTTVGTATDATADTTTSGSATAAQKRAFDISHVTLRQVLTDDGHLRLSTLVTVGDVAATTSMKNVALRLDLTVAATTPAHATVIANTAKAATFSANGKTIVCKDIRLARAASTNQFALSFPAACVPGTGAVSVATQLTATTTGVAKIKDSVAATPAAPFGLSAFYRTGRTDPAGDVVNNVDPNTNDQVASSADIHTVTLGLAKDTLISRIAVTDLSTRRYHPQQKFSVTFRNAGKALGTFQVRDNPDKFAQPTPATGVAGCDATAVFDDASDTVTLTVPADCFKDAPTVTVDVRAEVLDGAGAVLGYDTSSPTRLVPTHA